MSRFLLFFCISFLLGMPMSAQAATVSYEVIDFSKHTNLKFSIDILISQKVDEEFLRKEATEIYKINQGPLYRAFFVSWYLPGMKKDAGAWATTHFNPTLKIEIMEWMLEYNPPTLNE